MLRTGDAYNEQILLGIPGGHVVSGLRWAFQFESPGVRFDLRSPCELQFVSLAVWEKVVADFPEEQTLIFRSIRDTMAHKAAMKNHGTAMSSPDMALGHCEKSRVSRGKDVASASLPFR